MIRVVGWGGGAYTGNPLISAMLAYLLHRNPIASLWLNLEPLGRLLDGFLLSSGFNCAEMFGALADDIDAPAGQ